VTDRWSGAIAIVTGGGSGIGRALSARLASAGARVVVADVRAEAAREVAHELGSGAEPAALDVRDAAAVRELVERTARDRGRLDLVFNNAGIAIAGEVLDGTLADWDRTIDVNLRGVVHGSLPAFEIMARQGFGHIVNTASMAGLVPQPGLAAYSTTKHAVVGLSLSLRGEAARHGVRVSAVCPGLIDTPLKQHIELRNLDREVVITSQPLPWYPADRCARDVLRGVARNRAVILTPTYAWAIALAYRIAPDLVRWIFDRQAQAIRVAAAPRSPADG